MSTQSTASVNPTSQAQEKGRDGNGRFTAGNRGGPGNPFARQVAGLRQALLNCVTPDDIQCVAQKLVVLAKEGNVQAAKLLFTYTIGKPQPAPEPDRMDVDEWEGYQQTAGMKAEAAALSNVGTPEFHLNFVRTARPLVTTLMQQQMAAVANETPEQREKREAAAAAECERILNSPAPPSPFGADADEPPSPNGKKRRSRAKPGSANNGAAPMPSPSTNGRFHGV